MDLQSFRQPFAIRLFAALPGLLQPGDSVLIKASHGMGYTKIVEALEK